MSDASIGNDLTVQALHYAIDGLSLQQDVVANNVSNDQTPNFIASDVDFETSLSQALQTPSPGTAASTVVYASPNAPGTDGNNVDMVQELVQASQDTLQYQTVVNALNFNFNLLSQAMGEGSVT